ncbi:hypothetical protein N7534_002278 [Penicillium rubens]|nr:hypothetical protein N7534_002278 [Penicillium rubens]
MGLDQDKSGEIVHLEATPVTMDPTYMKQSELDLAMAHPWAGVGRPWGRPRSPWAGRVMGRPAHGQRRAPMGRPSTAHQRTTFPNRMNKSLIQPVKYRLFIHVIFHTLLDV